MKKIFLAALLSITAVSAFASESNEMDPRYFQISSMEVKPLNAMEEKLYFRDLNTMAGPGDVLGQLDGQLDLANIIFDKIINLGQKAWNIIEKGRPVANVTTMVATALPQGAQAWNQLEQWQAPRSQSFRITYKNGFGADVVDFVYRAVFVAGGSVQGKGKYIGYATVEPSVVNVLWGYTFNAEVTVPTVFKMGTSENPIGAMNLNVKWTVDTVLVHSQQSQSYFINALGEMKTLN